MSATFLSSRSDSVSAQQRPLTLLAPIAGAVAAVVPLLGAMAVAVVGWFMADAGGHGAPRDALRSGALGWLMGHGSGITVDGVRVTAVPLGITVFCAWMVWRTARRLGEGIAGHGPDADALSDGDRDVTVPLATGLFASAYLVVATLTVVLASTGTAEPSIGAVVGWSSLMTIVLGGAGIAVGSGRAAVWLQRLPEEVRATGETAASVVLWCLGFSGLVLLISLVIDLDVAANVLSQMHTDTGDAVLFIALMALALPNAVVYAASFLLGPGFLMGAGTLVSPTAVAVGPVPMIPLLAALPDNGPTPVWMPFLMVLPPLAAAVAVFLAQRRRPRLAWDRGVLHGLASGVLAGVVLGLFAALSGGAIGPGRMAEVGPLVGEVLLTGMLSLGLGGLVGAVIATALARRAHADLLADSSGSAD